MGQGTRTEFHISRKTREGKVLVQNLVGRSQKKGRRGTKEETIIIWESGCYLLGAFKKKKRGGKRLKTATRQ